MRRPSVRLAIGTEAPRSEGKSRWERWCLAAGSNHRHCDFQAHFFQQSQTIREWDLSNRPTGINELHRIRLTLSGIRGRVPAVQRIVIRESDDDADAEGNGDAH